MRERDILTEHRVHLAPCAHTGAPAAHFALFKRPSLYLNFFFFFNNTAPRHVLIMPTHAGVTSVCARRGLLQLPDDIR